MKLAQSRITKVVVYITTDLTKLVSHFSEFSVIFYAIYKVQQICVTIGVTFCESDPGKICSFAMYSSGWPAGAAAGIRRGRRRSGLGKGRRMARGVLGPDLGAWPGRWRLR
jgi:hypothetical protein